MIELLVMAGIGLGIAGWWLVRRGQRSPDAGWDPGYTPYGDSGPLGCRATDDSAAVTDPREADAACSEDHGGNDDCADSGDSSDGGD